MNQDQYQDRNRWELAHRVADIIALAGFIIPLVWKLLQVHGVVNSSPDREILIIGGTAGGLLAVIFIGSGVTKLYRRTVNFRRYRRPGLDLLLGVMCATISVFCLLALPGT